MASPLTQRSTPPRSAAARVARLKQHAFFGRLMLTVALTLIALCAAHYVVLGERIESSFVRAGERSHAADALSVQQAYDRADGENPLAEAEEVVSYIAHRHHVTSVAVIDARGVVIAAGRAEQVGEREPDQAALVRSGATYAGPEREAGENRANFEYVAPLRLGGKRYALETDLDGTELRQELASFRRTTLLLSLAGLLLAVPLFYLLGGRSLNRLHRVALNRAARDGLTDLGNQSAFQDELHRATATALRYEEPLSVAVVDLDDFKLVNDRKGHRQGDRLLAGLAGVLRQGRPEDRAFRIGGDEFALIMPRSDADGAKARLDRMRSEAAEQLGGVTLSVGVAQLDPATQDAGTLLEQADAAVYEAKRLGRDRVATFAQLDETMVVTAARLGALHRLLDGAPPAIAFQPIWELAPTGNLLVGYEALARPDVADLAGPAEAFALAERIGRAHELDALCRRATLARVHELPRDALLFLNVSPQSFDLEELAGDSLVRAVRTAGLEPERVVLEITERSSARLDRVVREATRLRELGFRLALDDVGAGNAGLEMLRSLPVDFVKIDRAVIAGSARGGGARAILHAVIAFANEVGAFVIAEGIETEAMLEHVRAPQKRPGLDRRTGVHGAQGYLLGRPHTGALTDAPVEATVASR
jgi:diguanylate cyclase (GGDEF)-like protein